ncbi:hypothetical protein PG984_015578 [Apiospora sp. TS-2023a]
MDRRTALVVCFAEGSLAGMVYEAIGRGFDHAAAFNDAVFSSPGTDVLDVGSDLLNSEVLNSFLNTADLAETGVVTEEGLRRVYDAYAHAGARMFTERWHEPTAKMNAQLYVWHMVNDRHLFLRRAVLGYSRVRLEAKPKTTPPPQQQMAEAYHLGLVQQMAWLVSHASRHAWQVNYIMETAMFGSLLDDGGLVGKLDRAG